MNNGLAQLPIGNLAAHQENLSLLALPPPIASPSIAGGPTNLPRAHQLALPGPASYMNPPAPKYPPPPGFAKALPPPQDLLPPIYFNKAGMPQLPALPSFEPQPKVATPPATGVGGGHLGGMRAISPRNAGAKPPPPAILPPTMASTPPPPMEGSSEVRGLGGPPPPAHPKPPPGPPGMSTEGSHFAVREETDFCVLDGSRQSGSEASRSPSRTPVEEIPDLFAGEGGRDEVSSEEGGMERPPPPPRPPNLNLSGSNMPNLPTYGASFEPKTPSMPPPSTRGFLPATPKGMPPIIPFGTMRPDTMVQRGQPPAFHPAPFKMPPPPGMPRVGGGGPPGMPPGAGGVTGYELAIPRPPGADAGPPGLGVPGPGFPGPISPGVPLPPPPPREDDSAFVRRVRLIYMDRVMREHQKQEILELDAVGRPVPNWVFNLSTVMPYLTAAAFLLGCICVILIYAIKFDAWQEEHW
eukprot:g19671.t1